MNRLSAAIGALIAAFGAVAFLGGASLAHATQIGPQTFVYNGHLLDSSSNAITSAHTVRFSFWTSADYVSGDVTETGSINIGASNYASWKAAYTVTPDSKGYFTVQLGSGTALSSFASYTPSQLQSLHLQVEVKGSSAAQTAYELLDVDANSGTVDRSPLLAVPFAINADLFDKRDTGTGSGSIPVLLSGGLLPISTIPGGTNSGSFVIDHDGSVTTTIALQFGKTLGKALNYDGANSRFNFDDDVRIQGDLTVTGSINGVDITTLSNVNAYLRVSSGAGLTINIGAGSYRLQGSVTNYSGASGVAVANNATNYVFFTSTGAQVGLGGFPANHSAIRSAEVVTSGGVITSVTDRRVLSNDDREVSLEKNYHAAFEHATPQGDATNNVGQLGIDHDTTNLKNFYKWISTNTSLQDYDVIVRTTLSSEFLRWGSGSLVVKYRSTSASTSDNKLDVSVFDTNGSPVTLAGASSGDASTDLASTTWKNTTLNFGSSSTWTAGQDFLVKFKLYSKDSYQIHLGDMKLRYVELPSG